MTMKILFTKSLSFAVHTTTTSTSATGCAALRAHRPARTVRTAARRNANSAGLPLDATANYRAMMKREYFLARIKLLFFVGTCFVHIFWLHSVAQCSAWQWRAGAVNACQLVEAGVSPRCYIIVTSLVVCFNIFSSEQTYLNF